MSVSVMEETATTDKLKPKLTEIEGVDDYLRAYGPDLAARIVQEPSGAYRAESRSSA